ncbi:MAG: RNA-binding protein [Chlamydiales bacterium]|nr:RNA-binding protein [Chlamydiales bacterium]
MKIFVGNLSYHSNEADLKELFAQYGEVVSVKVISDPATGRSKGFAFVEMATREGGQEAVKNLNGKEIDGRAINVDEARPQVKRGPREGGGGGFGGGGGGGGGRDSRGGGDRPFRRDSRGGDSRGPRRDEY